HHQCQHREYPVGSSTYLALVSRFCLCFQLGAFICDLVSFSRWAFRASLDTLVVSHLCCLDGTDSILPGSQCHCSSTEHPIPNYYHRFRDDYVRPDLSLSPCLRAASKAAD